MLWYLRFHFATEVEEEVEEEEEEEERQECLYNIMLRGLVSI